MKALMENWRRFLGEQKSPIKKLRIFDFDETIAYTSSRTGVLAPGAKEWEWLEGQEAQDKKFAELMSKHSLEQRPDIDPTVPLSKIGYEFNFKSYSEVLDPKENELVTNIIRRVIQANRVSPIREVYVMTARSSEAKIAIEDYLRSIGLDPRKDFTAILTLTGASKGDKISEIIASHPGEGRRTSIESVHFFDDSERNLADVKRAMEEWPEIEDVRIKHVIEGEIRTVKEGEVVQGPWKSRLETAVDELYNVFKIDPEDPDEESAFTRDEIRSLIDALETRNFMDAIYHVFGKTLHPETIMDIYPWYKKWFKKVNTIIK